MKITQIAEVGGGSRVLCVIMTHDDAYENQYVIHPLLVPIKEYGF